MCCCSKSCAEKKGLCTCSFAVAFGLWWGLSLFLMALVAWLGGWGTEVVHLTGSFYAGYAPSLKGSLIGLVWGFFEGAVSGFVLAWLYNRCLRCRCRRECHAPEEARKDE